MNGGDDGPYAAVLHDVEELEGALRAHRRHVIDSASMSALPTMVTELSDLDHRVAAIREQCERRLPVQAPHV